MRIHLIFPYLASPKCLLAQDNGDCDGWSKSLHWRDFSLISDSFKYALVLHRGQKPRWLCLRMPQGARAFGWRPSVSHRTASADWPKYIVLSSGGTFSLRKVIHASWAARCQTKWFTCESQLGHCSRLLYLIVIFILLDGAKSKVIYLILFWCPSEVDQVPLSHLITHSRTLCMCKGLQMLVINIGISVVAWPAAETCWF